VQTRIARYSAQWLSKELNTDIRIGGLDITWFLDLTLEEINIKDKSGKVLLQGDEIKVDFNKISIPRRFMSINKITIRSAEINLVKYTNDSTFNYNFILDYFKVKEDTLTTVSRPWKMDVKGVRLDNCSLLYSNQNKVPHSSSIDYNNILVSNIDFDAENVSLAGDSITVEIKNLAGKEKSGLTLIRLAGSLTIKPHALIAKGLLIMTPGSDLRTDLRMSFTNLGSFNQFIDSVSIEAAFEPSIFDLNEIRYFASEVEGMENFIHFNGKIRGKISSLKARDFHFSFGSNSSFDGEINMDGLPDIQETFINLKVKKLTTDYYDLTNIRLPGNKRIKFPNEVKKMGIVDVKGFFTGFINDFVSSADFTTSLGKLETDLSLQTGRGQLLKYNGKFNLTNWELGETFDITDKAGVVSITSSVNGEVVDKNNINVKLIAKVEKVFLLGNEFNDININGQLINRLFNGDLVMKDELANLSFSGMVDFTDTIPVMNFTALLKDAYLARLNLWEHDSTARISTKMDLNFKGSNLDNLLGYLRFDSISYSERDKSYFVNRIELTTNQIGRTTKKLSLKSDLLDASFYGVFSFGNFYSSLSNIVSAYLPSLNLKKSEKLVSEEQLFEYSFDLKNLNPITEIFIPDFQLKSRASIYGSYDSQKKTIILNGMTESFSYKGTGFKNWYVRGKNYDRSLQLTSGVSTIEFNENEEHEQQKLGIENFVLKTFMQGDSINYDLSWDDKIIEDHNKGHIEGYFSFSDSPRIRGKFKDVSVKINNRPWSAVQHNEIIIDSTSVYIDEIRIASNNQKLRLAGKISDFPEDKLTLAFEQLDVSNADILIGVKGVDFDGILTGNLSIKDIYNSRQVEAQVEVKDFAFNKERMGDATVRSTWVKDIAALDIQADVIYKGNIGTHLPISAKGLIYPGKREEGNFDMDVNVINYKLASLNPFLRGIASNIKGFASGNLRLEGTFRNPVITGELDLLRTQLKIDYLNVTYAFAHRVIVKPELISAKGVSVYDSLGNTATLDFDLTHKHFRDILLNIGIEANNLSSLNTTYKQNNLFYGNAFGSGNVNINGSFKDISINIDANSDPNTMVYIPINLAVGASEKNFIRFRSNGETKEDSLAYVADESGVDVFMNLNIDKDAGMQLFLPENIGNIKGNGTGIIQMGINKQGEMSIYGDYRLNQGSFLFTLGNIINRSFSIQPGSTISFNGSPYDANINLSAVYKLKASLKSISEQYDKQSIPVDCIIMLKNDLYNPDISFSISLPQADDELNQIIYSAIDTTNQVVMTQQMVSLLVFKTFSLNASQNFGTNVGSSSIDMFTDQLSNMLSQIIKDVDIGVKYRTGDNLTEEEVEVALSTNLFNDRVSIDGNVGMYTQGTATGTNNIVGDVMVDVKITPDGRFRVKAFNRSNQFDVDIEDQNKYKQGIGIYYRYEFDRFSEIFTRKKKKEKKAQ
jgi:hypothetical protein